MYGMEKTTVYLPSELKRALERAAKLEGRSEADLIREGVAVIAERHAAREPTAPLFNSGDPDFASRVDELMEGFGE
jgi:Arc/MetJ-type ribon-helix-helix transcriptional regulator